MNSPQVRSWAAAFVQRLASIPNGRLSYAVTRAYSLALNRAPTKSERADAIAFIEAQMKRYQERFSGSTGDSPVPSGDSPDGRRATVGPNGTGRSAKPLSSVPVGESPTGAGESPALPVSENRAKARELALTDFAQVLFSLNEFIYVE
jgi:hypothetical protein